MSDDTEADSLTPAQREALQRAYSILGEHFDGAILAVVTEAQNAEEPEEAFQCYFKGGYTLAIGLAQRTLSRLCQEKPSRIEPE